VGLLTTVTLQLGHKQFVHALDLGLVLVTFAAVSVFHVPLYLVLLIIGPIAVWLYRPGAGHVNLEERTRHLRERLRHRHSLHIRH
jgi:chromate transporter